MSESWGSFITGVSRKVKVTGGESSIPDDAEPQVDHPYKEIDAVSAYPPELRNSPLVHIQCMTECVTGDPECPGIRLTQLMKPR